jgi:hypothetical protein
VPVPVARDYAHLNELLLEASKKDEERVVGDRQVSVGAAMAAEREHLLPLAKEGFDLAAVRFPEVNSSGCAKVLTNFYSVPLAVGTEVQAKIHAAYVEIWHQGKCLARHERCFGRQQKVLDLDHYLEVLEKKPGALAGSTALEQWRAQGRWPASYDRYWDVLQQRQGKQAGTRAMIEILLLGQQHGAMRLREAIEEALQLGCSDAAAIQYQLTADQLQKNIGKTEPVIFLGETGTGKTHLAIGLGVAACRQRRRVRFTTAAEMVNELVEAKQKNELSRVTARWTRYELLVIDEMGYVALAEAGAEMLFQVIAGRAEKAAVIITTNLPFSEWTTVFPNARLCQAMLDRVTDQAHIIETGSESYRFRRTLEKRRGKGANA